MFKLPSISFPNSVLRICDQIPRRAFKLTLAVAAISSFGAYAVAQNSSIGNIEVEGVSSNSASLRLPALPAGATDFTLQRQEIDEVSTSDTPASGSALWLNSTSLSELSDGSSVASWESLTGGYKATQSNPASRPTWLAHAGNGKPIVRFDGQDDFLQLPKGMRNFSEGLSAFVVAKPLANHHWARFFDFGNGSRSDNIFLARVGTSNDLAYESWYGASHSGVHTNAIFNSSLQLYGVVHQAADPFVQSEVQLFRNGQLLRSGHAFIPRVTDRNNNFIGKSNWPDALFSGDIAEIVIYDKALSTLERKQTENYLLRKYAMQLQSSSNNWSTVATGLNGGVVYQDSSLAPDTTYVYRCVTTDNSAISEKRFVKTLPPLPLSPIAPTFTNVEATSVRVSAASKPLNSLGVSLQYKLESAPIGDYVTVTQNTHQPFSVTTLEPQTVYSFRFVAWGEGGSVIGPVSNVATTNVELPGIPAAPSVKSVTSTSIQLELPPLPAHSSEFKLQRATGQTIPAPPTQGLALWLKGDSEQTVASGTPVSTWNDRSGNGRDAAQPHADLRPYWVENVLNGRPAVRLDGIDDQLRLPHLTNIRTVLVVTKHKTGSQHWAPLLGSPQYHFHGGWDDSLFWWDYTPNPVKFGKSFVNGTIIDVLSLRKPTDFQVITLIPTMGMEVNSLATQDGIGGRAWNGDYAEVMLYDRTLSVSERLQAERYLMDKYGLSGVDDDAVWNTIATNLTSNGTYNDTELSPGTTYFYRCVAIGASGETPGAACSTSTQFAVPATPATPTFSQIIATSVRVNSIALPVGATQLLLQRRLASENDSSYTTVSHSAVSEMVVEGLSPLTEYAFRYVAVNDAGRSFGNSSNVTTVEHDPPAAPAAPISIEIGTQNARLKMPNLPERTTTLSLQRSSVANQHTQYKPPVQGLKLWLDARAITSTTGERVEKWWDSSGNANHATQSSVNSRPQLITNAFSGQPVVRFSNQDGVADFLRIPATNNIRTAVVVARHQIGSQHWAPLLGSTEHHFHGGWGEELFHPQYTSPQVWNGELYINGSSVAMTEAKKSTHLQILTVLTTGPTQIDKIATQSGFENERSWLGDFAEVLLYDRVLSSVERLTVERYLSDKYRIGQTTNDQNPNWQTIASELGATQILNDQPLEANEGYLYRCIAVGPGGQTAGSHTFLQTPHSPPTQPTPPILQNTSSTSVDLILPPVPEGAYSLQVEYKLRTEDTKGYRFGSASYNSDSVTVAGLKIATDYDFRVIAVGKGGRTPSEPISATTGGRGEGTGLTGYYYRNVQFENGPSLTRLDSRINFDWHRASPAPGVIPTEGFSVRWRGEIVPLYSEKHKFWLTADDGVRFWINNQLVIDYWGGPGVNSGEINLVAGKRYDVRLEFRDGNNIYDPFGSNSDAHIKWEWESESLIREVVPTSQLYPFPDSQSGLTARYFEDENFTQFFATRRDAELNFNWNYEAPVVGMQGDTFSARWSGKIRPNHTEIYKFTLFADDTARFLIDGQVIAEVFAGGSATGTVSLIAGHKHDIQIVHTELQYTSQLKLFWESDSVAQEPVPPHCLFPETETSSQIDSNGNGLFGSYFNNLNFSTNELVLSRTDSNIDFRWPTSAPFKPLTSGAYCVRWKGQIKSRFSETYRIILNSRERCRLWIGGQLVIDRWNIDVLGEPLGLIHGSVDLVANQAIDIKVEMGDINNHSPGTFIHLLWSSPSQELEIIPQAQLFSVNPNVKMGDGKGLTASYFLNEQRMSLRYTQYTGHPNPCDNYHWYWYQEPMPTHFFKLVHKKIVPKIDFEWGDDYPWGGSNGWAEDFSARWRGHIQPLYSETYIFKTETNEGVRLWINGEKLIDNWELGGTRFNEGSITLQAGQKYSIVMEMFDGNRGQGYNSSAKLFWSSSSQELEIVPQRQLYPLIEKSGGSGSGLRGHYYRHADHTNKIGDRVDSAINFDWSDQTPFDLNRNTFAVRWTGLISSGYSELYRFTANTNSTVRVWIGNQPIINNEKRRENKHGQIFLHAGVKVPIVIEFVQSNTDARLQLEWESQHQEKELIPTAYLYPNSNRVDLDDLVNWGSFVSSCPMPFPPLDKVGSFRKVDVPSQMVAGSTRDVELIFKNISDFSPESAVVWSTSSTVAVPHQNYWGELSRLSVANGPVFPEGSSTFGVAESVGDAEFRGKITAPTTPGVYEISWELHYKSSWWGYMRESTPVFRIRVVAPTEEGLQAPEILDSTEETVKLRLPSGLTL